MSDFEQLRQRHVADAMALAPEMIARIDWSADRLAAHRQDRLRALVTSAVARSPWHAKRLAGLDVGRLDETSLDELPTMTKDDLMDRFDEVVTDKRLTLARVNDHLARLPQAGYLLDRYTAVASGGSTGRRGVFVYDWAEWTYLYVGLCRAVRCCGPLDLDSLQRDIVHALARVGLPHPEVRVSTVERIDRGVAGKLERFVPLPAVRPAVGMTA
jgi:phenylacetate-coenzyme A ligase PaaK-like adenylate-forming protein